MSESRGLKISDRREASNLVRAEGLQMRESRGLQMSESQGPQNDLE